VLLVEDSSTTARATARLLTEGGVSGHVTIVGDAESARRYLKAGAVDLLVIDLSLADDQGIELLQEVRATAASPALPVVVLSGMTDPEIVQRSYALGANCFVRKPRRVVELVPAVRAIEHFWLRHVALPGPARDDSLFQLPLAATADAVREARSTVRRILTGWGMGGLGDVAELCTSELATNAVIHAQSPVLLVIALLKDAVRVEVDDEAPGELEAGTLIHDSETGRGLALVDALSACWGVEQHDGGKSVWFELRRPDAEGA
jgi:CheY-like chemotaxis protein/anti-sigma regulatory factor (Ser/Thr protein kinase)